MGEQIKGNITCKNESKKGLSRVVILCGGEGTRLKPWTDEIPKALVPLKGKPILNYIVDFYKSKGFSDFILCVGYKGHKIKEHYSGFKNGANFQFSDAGENVSMIKRIFAVRDLVDDTFFVSYGDTLIDLDVEHMIKTHKARGAEATIVTAKIRNPFGLITSDEQGWATSFVEKPLLNYYIGSFILEKSALSRITEEMAQKVDAQGLLDFFLEMINRKKMATFEHEGPQITFNTETERQLAEENLGQFYTFLEEGDK